MPFTDEGSHYPAGPIARALCRLFGHAHESHLYLSTGKRSVTDGIGRLHVNIVGNCRRCEALVEFGQLHVPNGPWRYDHVLRQYFQDAPAVPPRSLASWDAEHPQPVQVVAPPVLYNDPAKYDPLRYRKPADDMLTSGWADGIGGKQPPG